MAPLPFKEMPSAEGLPILGNALKLTSRDFHRDLYEFVKELGGIYKISAPGNTIVVISDPKILEDVVAREFEDFVKPPELYKTFAELCSTTKNAKGKPDPTFPVLATSNKTQWEVIREGFSLAFAEETVPQYLPTLVKEIGTVLDQTGLAEDEEQNIMEYVGRISLSATGKVMFNYDFQCTDLSQPSEFWQAVIQARMGAVDKARSPVIGLEHRFCPFLPGPEAFKASKDIVYKTYEDIYSTIVASSPPPPSGPPTIQSSFWTTRDWQNPTKDMSKEDTIATIGNWVVAGTLPAATAVAFTLALIACDPRVQHEIHKELDDVGLDQRPFEASDVPRLKYLGMVVKEAMRVEPTIPQVIRATDSNVVLGGYEIPKGTVIMLSLGGLHTSPHNYTNPYRFWPERWEMTPAEAENFDTDPDYPNATPIGNKLNILGSVVPFSIGNRACLGQHWARLSIITMVASILSRFTLSAPDDLTPEKLAANEVFSISIYPHNPIILTFNPRKKSPAA